MDSIFSWPWPLLFPLFFLFLFLLSLHFIFRRSSPRMPPGPRPWPIVGNLPQIAADVLVFRGLSKLSDLYGPIMTLSFGSLPAVIISSPEMAKEVLKDFDSSCCSRWLSTTAKILTNNGKDIVFSPAGPHLKVVRRLCAVNLFNKRHFDMWKPLRLDEVRRMCDAIGEELQLRGGLVGLRNHIFCAAVNHTLRICVGKRFESSLPGRPNPEGDKFFRWMEDMFQTVGGIHVGDFVTIFRFLDLQGVHALASKLGRDLDAFFTLHVREHEKKLEIKTAESNGSAPLAEDLCDSLILAKESEPIDEEVILGVLKDMVLGGSDTTSVTTEWAMLELIRHPEKMSRLQSEIDPIFEFDDFELENRILQLPYLKAVVKETLRLHPPTPLLIPHLNIEEVKLGGGKHSVPSNTMMIINAWAISHNEKYWPDPFAFNPERFLDNPTDFRGQNFSFIPFGSGRRMCPGMNIGSTMVTLLVAHMVHRFDWSTGLEPIDNTEKMGLTVPPLKPLEAIAKPRF